MDGSIIRGGTMVFLQIVVDQNLEQRSEEAGEEDQERRREWRGRRGKEGGERGLT